MEIHAGHDDTRVTSTRVVELRSPSAASAERGKGISTLLLDEVTAELDSLDIGDLPVATCAADTGARRSCERRGLYQVLRYRTSATWWSSSRAARPCTPSLRASRL
ncbi:hypothetical protein [Streptomyces sp. NPDC002540]